MDDALDEGERKVDERSGRRLAYEWMRRDKLPERGQRRRYAELMCWRCVAESIRLGETEDDLWQRLSKAGEILDGIWYALAPYVGREHRWTENVPEKDRAKVDQAREWVWVRYDPSRIHDLGYEATDFPGVDRKGLADYAAEYLERPWLRLAVVDWLLVDSFVTGEMAEYGEHLKVLHLPGPTDPVERIQFDRKTKGDVEAIRREGRRYRKRPVRNWLALQVVFPIVTVGSALWFEAYKTAGVLLVLSVLDFAFFLVRLLLRGFRRMRATPEQLRTPMQVDYAHFQAMREIWHLLEGPVVNPTLLRAEMVKTSDEGAAWNSAAWAIVDRAIGIDPAVWITSFPSD